MRSGNFSVLFAKNPSSDPLYEVHRIRENPVNRESRFSAAAAEPWSRLKRRHMDALQETPRSPRAQPLVQPDEESGTETTEMDVQVLSPQDSSREVDSAAVAERQDGQTWTEDGWQTVLRRRQKKSQTKKQKNAAEAADCNTLSSSQPKQGSQEKRERRPRRRRPLPPLPKEDIKIVLRPHKGLAVKDLLGYELSTAVIDACHRHFDGSSFMLRIHPGSNIIILSTPHEHVAKELTIRADPEGVLRGIVHGIPSGTSQAELMANLRVRTQGVKIERARMLGSTKTAIITFTGSTLPRCVYFMGAEAVCYPHKPTKQGIEPTSAQRPTPMYAPRVEPVNPHKNMSAPLSARSVEVMSGSAKTETPSALVQLPPGLVSGIMLAIKIQVKMEAAACQPTNTVSWATIASPSAPLTEDPGYQKIVAEHKQLALENEKHRSQIKEERREFQKIISSLETKLEARLNALEANNKPTHATSKALVAHSPERETATVDIPQTFSEEASISQLQMGEQLQYLQNLMRELQSQQQRVASELGEQMLAMFSEYKKQFAVEMQQQRQYVNESVAGMQRVINKRVSVTPTSSPLPKDRRITENVDVSNTGALVTKSITATLDHYDRTDITHQIIDVLPQKRGRVRTKVLNIYSPPKNRHEDFTVLLNEAARAVGTRDQLVVVGDFNAPSTAWGYVRDSPKGVLLEHITSKLGFNLITLPTAPTRLGNTISRDTCPDLTFTLNIKKATWSNLDENLGSDHYILSTSIASPKLRRVAGDVVMTDWVTFRKRPLPEQMPSDRTMQPLRK
ncbi:hypothetical protein HPB52_000953 [Rhipicephalus sanguineus]|uniref:Endonuclease/exonuclease/phosphatase domain-containing protein n=1 Tax=Rhipicephalus sanguineus TaxID=34632 RepID=A0A9D4SRB3_RHISA|nr:hypothetical protein HPB52_000953 [Rhipicephalus sanguineus]